MLPSAATIRRSLPAIPFPWPGPIAKGCTMFQGALTPYLGTGCSLRFREGARAHGADDRTGGKGCAGECGDASLLRAARSRPEAAPRPLAVPPLSRRHGAAGAVRQACSGARLLTPGDPRAAIASGDAEGALR